jgi:hypothetical protein
MKAEMVYGRLVKVENNTVTIEVEKKNGLEEVEYQLDIELDEGWVAANLGKSMDVVLIDGKVKSFRSQ